MRTKFTISIICICLVNIAFCAEGMEDQERDESLAVLSEVKRKFELSNIAANLEKEDPHQSLASLKDFLTEDKLIAMEALRYINQVSQLHPQPEVRQEVVDLLVTYYSDSNIGDRCYEYLLRDYQAHDFSESSKDIIRQKLKKTPSPGSSSIRLAGVANMQDQIPRLNEIIAEETTKHESLKPIEIPSRFTKTWDTCLAKARIGVKNDIDYCVSKIKDEVDNNPRFSVILLNDLGYIRQPESVELLKDFFLSDRKLPATEVEESFSGYLMPIMWQNLKGFPELRDVERLRSSPSEEIKICKDWVKKQTEFKIRR